MAEPAYATMPMATLLAAHPTVVDFFAQIGISDFRQHATLDETLRRQPESHFERYGLDRAAAREMFEAFVRRMDGLRNDGFQVRSLTLLGGHDKSWRPEVPELTLVPGEIVCVVGPTGSGKSRLLADIECLAQGDTPTGRRILLNGLAPEQRQRHSSEHKLVAQLSQNMNFVLDLAVGDFVSMHAESRMFPEPARIAAQVVACANDLAGEKFTVDTSVTQLSGGQSRALMIADTALLSPLPVVLIDEIENAGVDRKRALSLLVKGEKIVLMSTHDPLLALMGNRRVVIENGGIKHVLDTSEEERANLMHLERWDRGILNLRDVLRTGGRIEGTTWRRFQSDITPSSSSPQERKPNL
jgi:ABC-type lipoprotein export system ATPase subunit